MELMTALAVMGILVAIATPSFKSFSATSRIAATANSVVNAMAIARSEALRRSTPVAVCPSTDQQSCSNSTNWATGWIVFSDGSGTTGVLDSSDAAVQTWPAVSKGVTVTMSAANGDRFVRFDPRGMNSQVTTDTFTVTASGCAGSNATRIVLTVAGSPQTTKIACP